MAQVNVKIGGRLYRMACADGEEEHLAGLAARLDGKIDELRGSFGEIGDTRMAVMAALTIADQLGEAERRIVAMEGENDRLRGELAGSDARIAALAERVAGALGETKARAWITAARVVVDGEIATDPDRPTPHGHRWYISGG